MPRLGAAAPLDELAAQGIRCTAIDRFRNYVAFNQPIEGRVIVLRVLHGARDLETAFSDPEIG